MKNKPQKKDGRMTKTIQDHGYEYTLIEGPERGLNIPSLSFLGQRNWALKSCRKIK